MLCKKWALTIGLSFISTMPYKAKKIKGLGLILPFLTTGIWKANRGNDLISFPDACT